MVPVSSKLGTNKPAKAIFWPWLEPFLVSSRSFTALRKDAGLCCGSRLRKGAVFAYVGRIHNLKDLK